VTRKAPAPAAKRAPAALRPREVVLGRDACHDLSTALTLEWLETDGAGGYAALTVPFCPTRRQHGLLVAPYPGQARRHVFLQRFEETLEVRGRDVPLSTGRYPGLWSPHGHQSLERFEALPWPRSTHRVGDVVVTREVLMARGRHAVLVRWRVEGGGGSLRLRLRPLLPFRDADALTMENAALHPRVSVVARGFRARPYVEMPALEFTVAGAPWSLDADPVWYRRVEHTTDIARGYEGHEDVFCPGVLTLSLESGSEVVVAVSAGAPVEDPAAAFAERAAEREAAWNASAPGLEGRLAFGADHFLARSTGDVPWVVAGFPWFYGWGRDTFLSVPGLLFARGRVEEGGDVLEGALPFLRDGLFPNRFGEAKEDYATVDAPFLFARAVRMYERAGGRGARVRGPFLEALHAIVLGWERGNALGRIDEGGLPRAGTDATNYTWMDARIDGVPVTPRGGGPVEVAAMWVFLRRYLAELVGRTHGTAAARTLHAEAQKSAATFLARYWLPALGRLADGWVDGRADATIRPNMVLAAALEWTPLDAAQIRDVVETADAVLRTPVGLRTVDPAHPAYRPRYEGGVVTRDRAYHQGTVWPWLLGAFVEASLSGYGSGPAVVARLRALLDGLSPETESFGLGHLAEVYDADPPHRPGGTFAQAWSDAEVLRAYALLREARP
jgi:predicted glycogen debranching enzyme